VGWRGGVVVRPSDSWTVATVFTVEETVRLIPGYCIAGYSGSGQVVHAHVLLSSVFRVVWHVYDKLFYHLLLSPNGVICDWPRAVMLCGWEGNSRLWERSGLPHTTLEFQTAGSGPMKRRWAPTYRPTIDSLWVGEVLFEKTYEAKENM